MALSRASHQKIYRTVGLKLVPTSIFLFCVFETYLFICDWEKLSGQCWQCPLHWTGNLLEKETNKMAFFVTGPSHLTANRKKVQISWKMRSTGRNERKVWESSKGRRIVWCLAPVQGSIKCNTFMWERYTGLAPILHKGWWFCCLLKRQ